ncbi:M23 family metallopeptidase [Pyruvatibacter mobilis]|nr:M23 family metallopeptidase [Pyruvatibacter mobilis]GGD18476.1 periplasmic metalloprotease M23B family protein [Pyruvatibacter mobilis]
MRKLLSAAALLLAATIAPAHALDFQGRLVQGGMVIGTVAPGSEVTLDGSAVAVNDNGRFVIGFGRDYKDSALLAVIDPQTDEQEILPLVIEPRDYDIQRIDGLPPGKVTGFSEATLKRIRAENAQVASARANTKRVDNFLESFIWPVKGRISGVYGSQRVLNGEPRRPHFGIDIAAPTGTPIVAPAGGTVVLAEKDHFFTGGIIIIDHGYSLSSTLFHMDTVEVEVGQVVAQGDRVGTVGATGRATGPHLDWRMNWGKERLDPQLVVGPMPE